MENEWSVQQMGLPRGTIKLLGVIDMFTILIMMIVLWVYVYVKSYQIEQFRYIQFMSIISQ